jgi:type II secretory pathway component PulF
MLGDLVRRGVPLSQALGTAGSRPAVVAIVAGSERVGRVGEGLASAADLLERLDGVRRGVRSAMVYPAVIAALGLGIVLVISVVILPQFQRSFSALEAELPVATRVLLQVGGLLGRLASPRGAVMLAVVIALSQVFRAARRTEGSAAFAAFGWARPVPQRLRAVTVRLTQSLRIPIVDRLRTEIDLVVASRIMATMLGGGAVADDALEAAGSGVGTRRIRACIEAAYSALRSGNVESMLVALSAVLTTSEIEMLTVGHERGLSSVQWQRIAQRRAQALDELLRRFVSLTEPLMVVAVGLVVGAAVSALYLPTFRILDAL